MTGTVTGFGLRGCDEEGEDGEVAVVWLSICATAEAAEESPWRPLPLPTPPSTSTGDPEDLMASSEDPPGLPSPLFRFPWSVTPVSDSFDVDICI